jgi:hypothetical protein
MHERKLRAGDWVQVRSAEEILATLDEQGRLDGMPFMPEMLSYCGKTLPVFKRAHKGCDTICHTGARKIEGAVHLLESRCDGSAHGACEAACSLYWKEDWVKPVTPAQEQAQLPRSEPGPRRASGCSLQQLKAATRQGHDPEKGPRYACQATELPKASGYMSPYDPRQYIEDYRSGNVGLATLFRGFLYRVGVFVIRRGERLGRRMGLGDALAKALMACYDALQRVIPNGVPFPRRKGTVPKGQATPDLPIGHLRPGSWVRVKSYPEILATLNMDNKTRGLYFDAENVPYCGKEFPVRSLVNQIIDERTGFMLRFKSPSIILKNVYCQGTYSDNRMFCPRAIYPYWRPAWLSPVERIQVEDDVTARKDRVP